MGRKIVGKQEAGREAGQRDIIIITKGVIIC
jgi:hypothetical protein